jgi:hypothetical protein
MTGISEERFSEGLADIKAEGLKFGLIIGVVELVIMYGSYYSGMNNFVAVQFISKFIPYSLLILIIGGLNLRKKNGGYLTLKQGLQFAFLAYIISALMVAIGVYILFNIIDKDLTEKTMAISMERNTKMMEQLHVPQNEIDESIAQAKETKQTGFREIFLGFGYSVIIGFIKSMLIGFVIRKENKNLPQFK